MNRTPGRNQQDQEFQERVVNINRVAKVVKGGRRFSFAALVVIGDGKGRIGFGTGKAKEVPAAINKASRAAKRELYTIELTEGRTISHEVIGEFGASRVLMFPAAPGTGVIASGAVRSVLESMGVKDVLTKCVGSRNPGNAVRATVDALTQLVSKRLDPFEGEVRQ